MTSFRVILQPMSPWLKPTPLSLVLNEMKYETIATYGHTDEISLQQFIHHTPLFSTQRGALLLKGSAMKNCLEKRCRDLERAIS